MSLKESKDETVTINNTPDDTKVTKCNDKPHKTDLISRQAAIDAISCDITVTGRQNAELVAATIGTFADRIKALPSAQPEIIRCKDCKHWDGVDTCDVIDAPVWDNDFCSMAERRTDD